MCCWSFWLTAPSWWWEMWILSQKLVQVNAILFQELLRFFCRSLYQLTIALGVFSAVSYLVGWLCFATLLSIGFLFQPCDGTISTQPLAISKDPTFWVFSMESLVRILLHFELLNRFFRAAPPSFSWSRTSRSAFQWPYPTSSSCPNSFLVGGTFEVLMSFGWFFASSAFGLSIADGIQWFYKQGWFSNSKEPIRWWENEPEPAIRPRTQPKFKKS